MPSRCVAASRVDKGMYQRGGVGYSHKIIPNEEKYMYSRPDSKSRSSHYYNQIWWPNFKVSGRVNQVSYMGRNISD